MVAPGNQNGVKMGGPFDAGDVPKIIKIHKFGKMDPRDVPGSKRHPKGIQKAPKRHPKGIRNAPKRYPNGIQKYIQDVSKRHPKGHKNEPQGRPRVQKASKRQPKGIQKASKRFPKGVRKASKLIQIISHWNQHSKSPMQRRAKNPEPHQTLPNAE